MTGINFVNIGIVVAVIIVGTAIAFVDGGVNKADVVEGINMMSSEVSSAIPSSDVQAAMPELSYNSMNNSVVVNSGFTLLIIIITFGIIAFVFGCIQGVCGFARMG